MVDQLLQGLVNPLEWQVLLARVWKNSCLSAREYYCIQSYSILGNPGLENIYIDGISLTHGAAGSRQHIWSFVTAFVETGHHPMFSCACTDVTNTWPYQVPSFIGDNYFCDTGNPGPTFTDTEV